MEVLTHPGDGVTISQALANHIRSKLAGCQRRFADRVTRVEVHLKDVNAHKGGVDKICAMEAHPAGLDVVRVDSQAEDAYKASHGAAEKLERALERRFAKAGRG
jgi:ribosomal subunit interface protein